MRTSRFALLVSAILISILFTALVVVNREAVAQPWPNIDITDIEPAPEYCMPVSNTLVLLGTGLTIPGIQNSGPVARLNERCARYNHER